MTVGDLIDGLINSATSVPNWFADGWQKLSKGELLELTIPQGAFTLLCIYVASMMLASWYTDFLIWKAERRLQKLKRRSTREEQSDEIDDADFALRVLKEKHDVFDLANSIFWVLALALGAFLVLLTLHSTGRM